MYEGECIVELSSKDVNKYTHPDQRWAREQIGKTLCSTCFKRRRDLYPTPVNVPILELEKGTSYHGIFRAGVDIIHEKLLAFLRPYLRDYVLGRCFWWVDGAVLPDYHSIYFRDYFTMRGDGTTSYYVCDGCGFIGGVSVNPYVLRSELPDGVAFQERATGLYVSADLARKLPWRQFPDLKPFMIPVRDEPLPDDPLFLAEHAPEKVVITPLPYGKPYEIEGMPGKTLNIPYPMGPAHRLRLR